MKDTGVIEIKKFNKKEIQIVDNVIYITEKEHSIFINDILVLIGELQSKEIIRFTKGIVYDLTGAFIHYTEKDIDSFAKSIKQTFINNKNYRISMIMNNPRQVIFPLLVMQLQNEVIIKSFYTAETAVGWIYQLNYTPKGVYENTPFGSCNA